MTDAGKRLVEILNRKRTEDTCSCSHCEEAIAAWDGQPCKTCGFAGKPVAIACQCYDHHCSGGTSAGAGCPHGALTCPVCDDGNLDAFAVIRELRSALTAFEVEQDEREARKTGRHPRQTQQGTMNPQTQPAITNSAQASNPLVIQPATVEEVARAHIKERMAWRTGHRRSEVADIRVEHLQTALRALEFIANHTRATESLTAQLVAIKTAIVGAENVTGDTSDILDVVEAFIAHHKEKESELKAERERVKKLQRAIDVVQDLGVYPAAVVGGPTPYEKRTERMEGWNEAVFEMHKAIAAAEPNIETSYDKLAEYIYERIGHLNKCAHSVYEVIDSAAELCKPQPPAIQEER